MPPTEVWTVGRLLQWTTDYLKTHGSDSPRLDAEVLLAEALGCPRIGLYTAFEDVPADAARTAFRDLVRRRAEGTPVAYLVGRREFYSLAFRVTPDVLIPRPETELLVVALLDLARGKAGEKMGTGSEQTHDGAAATASRAVPAPIFPQSPTIADVGTGSGIIAVCAAKHLPKCRVTAIDVSPAALAVARENAAAHGVTERIQFIESDLFAAVPAERKFDAIVSNPPYVTAAEMDQLARDVRKFEPRVALLGGPRGTEVIERLIPQAAERLNSGGHLFLEISPTIHDSAVALLAADERLEPQTTIKDLARLPRVVRAVRK